MSFSKEVVQKYPAWILTKTDPVRGHAMRVELRSKDDVAKHLKWPAWEGATVEQIELTRKVMVYDGQKPRPAEVIRSKHHFGYCDLCGDTVYCATCDNNCCNGMYGFVDGKPCPDCDEAKEHYEVWRLYGDSVVFGCDE